jgi:hypothetical protein
MNHNKKRSAMWRLLIQGRTFLINPEFQMKFMIYVVSCTMGAMSLVYFSQQYFFNQFYQKGEDLGLADNHPFFLLLNQQQEQLTQIFFVTSVIVCVLVSLWALFFSHRIAGPFYRLEKYFLDASHQKDQPLRPLAFRDNDFFQEIPDAINQYLCDKKVELKLHNQSSISLDDGKIERKTGS